jgi:hypothetical protein
VSLEAAAEFGEDDKRSEVLILEQLGEVKRLVSKLKPPRKGGEDLR